MFVSDFLKNLPSFVFFSSVFIEASESKLVGLINRCLLLFAAGGYPLNPLQTKNNIILFSFF
jgi:hypothetical protein